MQALLLRKLKANRLFRKVVYRIRLLSRKDRESYLLLYSILGYVPRDIKIYEMAMTHSSLSGSQKLYCNERLEFLGDAVLSSITADYLYSNFSKEREGFLTKSRSNLVCRERLNELFDEELSFRQGDGIFTDDEVSFANDPASRIYGQSIRTKKQREEFAQRERRRMVDNVKNLADKLHYIGKPLLFSIPFSNFAPVIESLEVGTKSAFCACVVQCPSNGSISVTS